VIDRQIRAGAVSSKKANTAVVNAEANIKG
jgi:hypothetical protein